MRQRRWLELVKDYDCEIMYHPGKLIALPKPQSEEEDYNCVDVDTGATLSLAKEDKQLENLN